MSRDEDSTLLSKLLNFNPFKSKNDSHPQQYEKQLPSNPINELQILIAHTDIVRIIQKIDETRYYNCGKFIYQYEFLALFTE